MISEFEGLERIDTGKDCPTCGRRLYKQKAFGGIIIPMMCECEKERKQKEDEERKARKLNTRIKENTLNSGFEKKQLNQTFDTFIERKGTEKALIAAKRFTEIFPNINCGLIFIGPCGSGKTHIASSIGNAILKKGYSVKFITGYELFEKVQDTYSGFEISEKMVLASNLAGKAINISRTTAAHAMSYKLTSLYGIGHGHGVALCIVPIWRMLHDKGQNDESLHNCLQELADVMSSATIDESIQRMERLINELNLPVKKVRREDVELLARAVDLGRMGNNPVIFTLEEIKELYKTLT